MSADGKWKATVDSPMGKQEFTLDLKTSGSHFTGSVTSPMGSQDIEGQVDGDKLTWKTEIEQPMKMTLEYEATVSGDSISGTVKAGSFGSSPFSGSRA